MMTMDVCRRRLWFHAVLFLILLSVMAAFLCLAVWQGAHGALSSTADFSSYWLGGWWMRQRPADVPLYYPWENNDRPNSRIWTMIRSPRQELLRPWMNWGARHGFPHPKFYLYPPIFAFLFQPLTFFSLPDAARIWSFLNGLAFLLALFLLAVVSKPRRMSGVLWLEVLLGLALLYYPTWWALLLGQNTLLLFLLWCAFLMALKYDRPCAAGVLLGVLTMVKLNPLLMFPWLVWRRKYRTLCWTLMTLAGLMMVSLWAAGWDNIQLYFSQIVPLISSGTPYYENQSLPGFLLRLAPGTDVIRAPPGVFSPFPRFLFSVVLGVFGLLTFWPQRRRRIVDSETLMLEGGAWMLLILITSPVSWSHHMVNALPALAFGGKYLAGNRQGRRHPGVLAVLVLGYALQAIPTLSAVRFSTFPATGLLSHRAAGVLILWMITGFLIAQSFQQEKLEGSIPPESS